ncbi:MAG: response regulator [Desulfobacteraceae bacterium]|nr:response regulator [Desulfobacteraceae bacterium]
MEAIVTWLVDTEQATSDFYSQAAIYFYEDRKLRIFFQDLSNIELQVKEIIIEVAKRLQRQNIMPPLPVNCENFKHPYREYYKLMATGLLTKGQLFECLFLTEFAKWNDIYIPLFESIKNSTSNYKNSISKIQKHKEVIERFLAQQNFDPLKIEKFKNSPKIWQEKILIVDDEPAIIEILSRLLSQSGDIHTATNGVDALEKVNSHYYKLIISDLSMPGMDGISFFTRASKKYTSIKNRFLFYTGDNSKRLQIFVETSGVRLIAKPSSLHEIRKQATEMIHH